MRIGIMSREPRNYSTQRLKEAAKARGHKVKIFDPLRCYMNISSNRPMVHYKKEILRFDAVIPRIGASVTFYGTSVLRQFEMMGVYCMNESVAISRSRDKLRSLQIMSRKGIGMPVTGFAHSTRMTQDLIDVVGGPPLLVKLLEGIQGKGVVLAETRKAAQSVIEAFRGLEAHFIVQSFVKESAGEDIRCFVINGKVVAAMRRKATDGDFRSNLHQGGEAEPIRITPAERRTAVQAARAMGLNVAGVDMLRAHGGPKVMEVNSSPGLEGIERATGLDLAGKIVAFIEAQARPHRNRTRGKG